MINLMDLSGKRILVYGDGSGIDKTIIEQTNLLGGDITFFDAKKVEDIESGLKSLVKDFGPFNGFVFTLVKSDFRPLQYVKPELIEQLFQVNYGCFIEAVRVLKKTHGLKEKASIVALSSISSIRAMKAKMIFCSAKAALDAAIRCLAVELADKGVRVNSVQKGVVDVDFEKSNIQDVIAINGGMTERIPLLGVTPAVEIANTVAFLLSDAAVTITGISIVVDGGYTL